MIDPTLLSNLIRFATAWGAAFLVTLWVSLVFWAYRDIQKRTGDRLLRLFGISTDDLVRGEYLTLDGAT